MVVPLGTEFLRFDFEVDPDADHTAEFDHAAVYKRLRDVYHLAEDDVEVYRVAINAFDGKLARHWRVGRVLLAGDAATRHACPSSNR